MTFTPTMSVTTASAPWTLSTFVTITISKSEDYGKSTRAEEPPNHIGNDILMSEGAWWKRSRNRLRSILSKTSLDETKEIRPHFEQIVRECEKTTGQDN